MNFGSVRSVTASIIPVWIPFKHSQGTLQTTNSRQEMVKYRKRKATEDWGSRRRRDGAPWHRASGLQKAFGHLWYSELYGSFPSLSFSRLCYNPLNYIVFLAEKKIGHTRSLFSFMALIELVYSEQEIWVRHHTIFFKPIDHLIFKMVL